LSIYKWKSTVIPMTKINVNTITNSRLFRVQGAAMDRLYPG
jgi:hypothetical protein